MFRYSELKEFLTLARTQTRVTSLRDWNGEPGIIMRHDVDVDVDAAHRVARMERDCNVRSSFLFLTTGSTYNCLSPKERGLIREIASWGFDVGLHFDPLVYGDLPNEELPEKVEFECSIISEASQRPVTSVSIHNPSIHGKYLRFDGYRNAYDPEIFHPDSYLSDSRMIFQRDPFDILRISQKRVCQVLLHPLHYTRSGSGYPGILSQFFANLVDRVDKDMRVNSTFAETVHPHLKQYVSSVLAQTATR